MFRVFQLLICGALFLMTAQAALRPEHVVVLYNEVSAFSVECAQTYAKIRDIPANNLIALNIDPKKRDITHEEFDVLMRAPLRAMSTPRDLQFAGDTRFGMQPIHAMVLMPDLPLRIKTSDKYADRKNPKTNPVDAASVDSELALVGLASYQRNYSHRNQYYKKDEGLPDMGYPCLSVCRIDSPSLKVTRALITTPSEVESCGGLQGCTVVDWGGPYQQGDTMFYALAQRAVDKGQQLYVHPLKTCIEHTYPMPQDCAMYFGWYSTNACGPFASGAKEPHFSFVPGAVAVHLHSFSATSLSEKKAWVGPLLMKGAAVTAGNTWEPYLQGTLDLNIFHERLLKGYCVAEAALMATPALSWQGVVYGDPLYRPYPKLKKSKLTAESAANALYLKKNYTEALDAFAALHKAAPDEASRLRAALACVQSLLLLERKAEAKVLLEEIALHESKSPYIGAVWLMKKHYFPAPAAPKKASEVEK